MLPRTAERDLSDEVQHYFDEAVREGVAAGLSRDDARRAARLDLGSQTSVRERVRESGWENVIGTVVADLRYAVRRLRHAPAFAAVTHRDPRARDWRDDGNLQRGQPDSVRAASLPGRQVPDRDLVRRRRRRAGPIRHSASYREVAQRSRLLRDVAVMKSWQPTLTGPDQPERLEGQRVSASYFRVLGVGPAFGRDLDVADDRLNGPARGRHQRRALAPPVRWRSGPSSDVS